MNINFEHKFLNHILSRGYDYYISGKVDKFKMNGDEITAIVHGKDDYIVSMIIEDNTFLDGKCSCSYNRDEKYCKHIAAVLYYLNEKKELSPKKSDDLKNIINRIDSAKAKEFLYQCLRNDEALLNRC